MRVILFSQFWIFFHLTLFCQPIQEIKGLIIDKENLTPIGDVIVYLHSKGLPTVFSKPEGIFVINVSNLGVDLNGNYRISFYKAGYETYSNFIDFPIKKPIELKKTSAGYVQLLEQGTNRFLDGILIKHQEGTVDTTDRFGFYKVDIPPGVSLEKDYRLAIDGGCTLKDTIVTFKKAELNDKIISIYITPRVLNYHELINCFDEELDAYYNSLKEDKLGQQIIHLDKCTNLLTKIQELKQKNKEDTEDARSRVPLMISILDELIKASLNAKDIQKLEDLHDGAASKFNEAYKFYKNKPPAYSEIPARMEELMSLGFITLNHSVQRWKLLPSGKELVEYDSKQIENLIVHLDNLLKKNKIPETYPNRDKINRLIEELITKSTDSLIKIIETANN